MTKDNPSITQMLKRSGAIIQLQGRSYVTYKGLLWVAHRAGLQSIDVDLLEYDPESRRAVVKATVTGTRGTYSDIGDASPDNVGKLIAQATIRMASTRAQSRALRSMLGIGITSLSELPGGEDEE